MIAHLKGTLLSKTTNSIIIDNSGMGYEVSVPLSTFYSLPEEDGPVSLHIHTHVREDALSLFGFKTILEKDLFLMLKSVSGIGPKLAINILSGIGPDDLRAAIAGGDAPRLQSIPGVGKKTAERIALELKDKALKIQGGEQPPVQPAGLEEKETVDDAVSALLNLGYNAKSAKQAVDKAIALMGGEAHLEILIKEALKALA